MHVHFQPQFADALWTADLDKADWLVQGQGNGAFVESVQQAIATELQVGIADMTNQEKKQLIKQYSKRKQ